MASERDKDTDADSEELDDNSHNRGLKTEQAKGRLYKLSTISRRNKVRI